MELQHKLYGAILGDLVGKPYEMAPIYSKEFDWNNPDNHWTDDTLMTLATANKLLYNSNYTLEYKWWGNRYYGDYYGKGFKAWIKQENWNTNDSWGNGAGMRVSPIGYAAPSMMWLVTEACLSADNSHSEYSSRKAAMFVASTIYKLNKEGATQKLIDGAIRLYPVIEDALKPFDKFKVSCDATVLIAFKVFWETKDSTIEDCIRLAISLGGDCDTIGSMAAEMWLANNKVLEQKYIEQVESSLDPFQLETLKAFNKKYNDSAKVS